MKSLRLFWSWFRGFRQTQHPPIWLVDRDAATEQLRAAQEEERKWQAHPLFSIQRWEQGYYDGMAPDPGGDFVLLSDVMRLLDEAKEPK